MSELNCLKSEQSMVRILLAFRHVAPFRDRVDLNVTGTENRGKISHF